MRRRNIKVARREVRIFNTFNSKRAQGKSFALTEKFSQLCTTSGQYIDMFVSSVEFVR
jgi:hypothetical protein